VNQAEDRKAQGADTPAKGGLQLEVFDVLPEIVLPDEESQLARLVVEMAGKKLVVLFLADPRTSAASAHLREFAQLYDAQSPYCRIYGITATPPEVNRCALEETLPFSLLSDVKGQVFRGLDIDPGARAALTVLIADEDCRILRIDRNADAADYAAGVLRFFQNLPKPEPRQLGHFAPILYIPKVFEPGFCEALIAFYEREGGAPSPSYVEEAGEPRFLYGGSKVRHDCQISDAEMIAAITRRISRRVLPGILKAFTRRVTGIEKFKIGCY
jgi:peroxiredoxin